MQMQIQLTLQSYATITPVCFFSEKILLKFKIRNNFLLYFVF